LGNGVARLLAREALGDQSIATVLAVFGVADIWLHRAGMLFRLHRRAHAFGAGVADRVLTHDNAWRDFAATDAWRWDYAHAGPQIELEQIVGARELAGDGVAYAHRHRWRRRLAFLNHFEVVVERRHLVNLGERKAHLLRERGKMRGRQVPVVIV